jgi:glycoprotein-N-acetylgalactosamine 3-beta-galactosyltransferase
MRLRIVRLFYFFFISIAISIIFTANVFLQVKKTASISKSDPKIFCIILSQAKSLETKAKATYSSWAHKCTDYRFISLIPGHDLTDKKIDIAYDNYMKVLKPGGLVNDTYGRLGAKVVQAFEDVYKMEPNYDWYLKCDDDTFVFYDNLRDFVAAKNRAEAITFGYDYGEWVYGGYHSGGGGYLLSHEAMKRFNSDWRLRSRIGGAEDVDIAKALRVSNVTMGKSLDEKGRERFHALALWNHYLGRFPDWLVRNSKNPIKNVRIWLFFLLRVHFLDLFVSKWLYEYKIR